MACCHDALDDTRERRLFVLISSWRQRSLVDPRGHECVTSRRR